MKKIILSLSLFLTFSSCAQTFEEKRAEWQECAQSAVTESEKKFEGKTEEEISEIVIGELCEFVKLQDDMDDCKMKLHVLQMNGQLMPLIETMVYFKFVVPACGEAPSED